MSFMDQAAFAPAGGIQELSLDEIDLIGGSGTVSTLDNIALVAGAVSAVAVVTPGGKPWRLSLVW